MAFLSRLKYEIKQAKFKRECEKELKDYLKLCKMQGDSPVCFYNNGKTTAVIDNDKSLIIKHEENNELTSIITYEVMTDANVFYKLALDREKMEYTGIEFIKDTLYTVSYKLSRVTAQVYFNFLEQIFEKVYKKMQ